MLLKIGDRIINLANVTSIGLHVGFPNESARDYDGALVQFGAVVEGELVYEQFVAAEAEALRDYLIRSTPDVIDVQPRTWST